VDDINATLRKITSTIGTMTTRSASGFRVHGVGGDGAQEVSSNSKRACGSVGDQTSLRLIGPGRWDGGIAHTAALGGYARFSKTSCRTRCGGGVGDPANLDKAVEIGKVSASEASAALPGWNTQVRWTRRRGRPT